MPHISKTTQKFKVYTDEAKTTLVAILDVDTFGAALSFAKRMYGSNVAVFAVVA